jgi:hypothetical protein
MNKRIQTYDGLVKEKQQLEALLQAQKELVLYDLKELKQDLEPAVKAVSFLGKIVTMKKDNVLLTIGVNQVIDVVFKKIILSGSGWLTRVAIPFFLKNYSSHYIAEHKDQIMEKFFSWFGHKNHNGQAAADTY